MRIVCLWILAVVFAISCNFGWSESSSGVEEVVKLAKAGVGEEVLLGVIRKSNLNFDITTDEIVMLNDIGVSEAVLSAIIARGKVIRGTEVLDSAGAPGSQIREPEQDPGQENAEHQQAPLVSAPPPVAPQGKVSVEYFYDTLSPYGNWVKVEEFGYCWQPSAVVLDINWRPYRDRGRWIWTDAGWFWQSGYSWGWAPFHYGRWHYHGRHRWIWTPDTVWAPAWVHWRSNDAYVGWAPLPPRAKFGLDVGFSWQGKNVGVDFNFGLGTRDFVFVASGGFLRHDLVKTCVPPTRVTNVYKETTIIKNTYITKHKTVINRGVDVQRIQRASKQELRPVRLMTMKTAGGRPVTGSRPVKGQLSVFRPQVDNSKPKTTPLKLAERRRQALEDRQERRQDRREERQAPAVPRATQPERTQTATKRQPAPSAQAAPQAPQPAPGGKKESIPNPKAQPKTVERQPQGQQPQPRQQVRQERIQEQQTEKTKRIEGRQERIQEQKAENTKRIEERKERLQEQQAENAKRFEERKKKNQK